MHSFTPSSAPVPFQIWVASRRMLDMAGVAYTKHVPQLSTLRLEFPKRPPRASWQSTLLGYFSSQAAVLVHTAILSSLLTLVVMRALEKQ